MNNQTICGHCKRNENCKMFLKDPHAVVSECGRYEENELHKSVRESLQKLMTCDKCKHFKVLFEPLKSRGKKWDLGRAICDKHDLIIDFVDHRQFKRLDTCKEYEPQERSEE